VIKPTVPTPPVKAAFTTGKAERQLRLAFNELETSLTLAFSSTISGI
jgi:hypothetical protein